MSTDHSNVDTGAEVAGTEADKINTGALGTLVTVGLFAMLTVTTAVTALVRHDIDAEQELKDADANQVVTNLKATQHAALNGPPKLLDRSKGVVTLPIELAKGLVVSELARDPNNATPPAPAPTTDASAAAPAAAGSAAAPATSGSAAAPAGAEGKGAPQKAEPGREVQKPAPGNATKPTPVPAPTPTAATPGAQAPGPTNK